MITLHTRSIAEHLSTFASLLEAEAMRANTLGLKGNRDIARQAHVVRQMADQLWEANALIGLEGAAKSTAHDRIVAHRAVH
jgi:hypothetical protein